MKMENTLNDAIHSGGIQYIFQAILCFSFGSISLDSQYDTLYCAPLRTEHNTAQRPQQIHFICIEQKPMTNADK